VSDRERDRVKKIKFQSHVYTTRVGEEKTHCGTDPDKLKCTVSPNIANQHIHECERHSQK